MFAPAYQNPYQLEIGSPINGGQYGLRSETIEINQLAHVEDGFKMEAFDLWKEWNNLKEGKITTREALNDQLLRFLEEYLTLISESKFEYEMGENGLLYSPGWTGPIQENFINAVNEPGISPHIRRVREAEKNSFLQLEAFMNAQKLLPEELRQKALIISPKENYNSPYAFIGCYELEEGNNGFKVKVRNRKAFLSVTELFDGTIDLIDSGILESPLHDDVYRGSDIPTTLLGNAFYLNPVTEFDAIFQGSRQHENFAHIDQIVARQLEEFQPEIDSFLDLFQLSVKQENYAEIEKLFRVFLVKAKIHFDENTAISDWGKEIVQRIKGTTLKRNTANSFLTPDNSSLIGDIFNLEIHLAGSCGTIGTSSIGNIIRAISPSWGGTSEADQSDKIFICPVCKHEHDITPEGGGLRPCCDRCGHIIPRCN